MDGFDVSLTASNCFNARFNLSPLRPSPRKSALFCSYTSKPSIQAIKPVVFLSTKNDIYFTVAERIDGQSLFDTYSKLSALLARDFLPDSNLRSMDSLSMRMLEKMGPMGWKQFMEKYIKDFTFILEGTENEGRIQAFVTEFQSYSSVIGNACARFDSANWHLTLDGKVVAHTDIDPANVLIDLAQKRVIWADYEHIELVLMEYEEKGVKMIRSSLFPSGSSFTRPLLFLPHTTVHKKNRSIYSYFLAICTLEQIRAYQDYFNPFMNDNIRSRLENMFSASVDTIKSMMRKK